MSAVDRKRTIANVAIRPGGDGHARAPVPRPESARTAIKEVERRRGQVGHVRIALDADMTNHALVFACASVYRGAL